MLINQIVHNQENLTKIRQYFIELGFTEVEPRYLHRSIPSEPAIYPFEVKWQTVQDKTSLYLATSPESFLKKLIAQGLGNCFAIGHCFRNLESAGGQHQPEFLMLEWYRKNSDYKEVMRDAQNLIRFVVGDKDNFSYLGQQIPTRKSWPVLSLVELFAQFAGIDLLSACHERRLWQAAAKKGYNSNQASFEQLFNQILLNEIEPNLPKNAYFLVDFPSGISPLAKARSNQPELAERFELILGGMEIANGCSEQNNPSSVKSTFQQEMHERNKYNLGVFSPVDEEFVAAVDQTAALNLAGVGFGLDRLAMLLANTTEISEVTGVKF